MIKHLFWWVLFLASAPVLAQDFLDTDLQSLVEAERAFAAMAKTQNTRDAFLQFLDDNAITSVPGKGPRKGKDYLKSQVVNDSHLHWAPVYSVVSASGDFGFNTGPWEFRQHKSDEKAIAFGQFVSMWKKDQHGEWKVVIDIGIGHPQPSPAATRSTSPLTSVKNPSASLEKVMDVEKTFIEGFIKKKMDAYETLRSADLRIYRDGRLPITAPDEIKKFLKEEPEAIKFEVMGGDIASSGDLAYVYGKTSYETQVEGKSAVANGSYMRFYRFERDGWKIVLDLIAP